MNAQELVSIAVERSKADLEYKLECLELQYGHRYSSVDDDLVRSYAYDCLRNVIRLVMHHRRREHPAAEEAILRRLHPYIRKAPDGYTLNFQGMKPAHIRFLPDGIGAILEEFNRQRRDFRTIVEEEFIDFKARLLAGRISETAIVAVASDLLSGHDVSVKVICRKDGSWKCIVTTNELTQHVSCFSDADDIREAIGRCSHILSDQ